MARSGGLWGFLRDTVERIVETVLPSRFDREPEPGYRGGDGRGDDHGDSGLFEPGVTDIPFVTDNDNPPGQENFEFGFELSGFLELNATFKDDYVNLEGEPVYLQSLPWADMDYFVVKVNEPGRDDRYVTILGPFDDYEDFLDHLEEWWEVGS